MILFKNILIMAFLFFLQIGYGQNENVQKALELEKEKNFKEAARLIKEAANHPQTRNAPYTWYVQGYIFRKLYAEDKNVESWKESLESFRHSMRIDSMGKYLEINVRNLEVLAKFVFNLAAKELNNSTPDKSIRNFERYSETVRVINPDTNLTTKQIEFYLALATVYSNKMRETKELSEAFFQKSKQAFSIVLELDSNNLSANYNIGTLYFNRGADMIKNSDYMNLDSLYVMKDETVEYFRSALPYIRKADGLEPNNEFTLYALAGIYKALYEIDKYRDTMDMLNRLKEEK